MVVTLAGTELVTTDIIKIDQIKETFSICHEQVITENILDENTVYNNYNNLSSKYWRKPGHKTEVTNRNLPSIKKVFKKYSYIINIQRQKIEEAYDLDRWTSEKILPHPGYPDFIVLINALVNKKYIPEKFRPETKVLFDDGPRKYISCIVITEFKEQIISFLMQKYRPDAKIIHPQRNFYKLVDRGEYLPPIYKLKNNDSIQSRTFYLKDLIKFFRSLCEHDQGMEFDDYIDNWSKKLLKEAYDET